MKLSISVTRCAQRLRHGNGAPNLAAKLATKLAASLALTLAMVLTGCAGSQAFREGNALLAKGQNEQGLAKLEQAVQQEPRNIEYRIALTNRRTILINRLNAAGEAGQRDGNLTDAEKAYRQIQAMDPDNPMARQGLDALAMARRHRLVLADCEALLKKGTPADLNEALDKLRPVLAENPGHKEAQNLKARVEEARAKERRPEMRLAAAFRQPISLEFREASLKAVLEVVAKVSGLNFFYDKDIRPDLKVTVFAKNTTIEDALRLLLVTNQLEQKVLNDNSLLIYPSTPQKLKDYQTLAVRSFYLTNADVKAVSNSIKTLLKTKDLVVDERLGIIMMRDTPEAIRMAERLVALQDLGDPEVVLEVEVLEIKRSRLTQLGIQWPSQLSLTPLALNAAGLTLDDLRHLNGNKIQATVGNVVINANKEDQDANILANPRIRVRNKEKAKVQIGDRVPVITTTSTSTGFVSESVSYVDVGLKLEVEPMIYLDDEVGIKVNLEVSNLVREILSASGTLAYQIGTRGANTVLRLKDGETQVLAGLINDEERVTANKLPGVGELPVAGRLFGSQKDDTQRSEILLSITPHVVRSIRRPDMLNAEFDSGTESSIGAQTLHLSTAEAVVPAATVPPLASAGAAKLEGALPQASPELVGASRTVAPVELAAGGAGLPATAAGSPVVAATVIKATSGGNVSLAWQAPAKVKAGEQFSAVLQINSQQALSGMPLLLGFDPQLLQVVAVKEGDFFKQGGGQTSFSQRVDAAQGKVFVALVRQGNGGPAGMNGTGALVAVTFKALKAAATARVQVLSATPEPLQGAPLALPVEISVGIEP